MGRTDNQIRGRLILASRSSTRSIRDRKDLGRSAAQTQKLNEIGKARFVEFFDDSDAMWIEDVGNLDSDDLEAWAVLKRLRGAVLSYLDDGDRAGLMTLWVRDAEILVLVVEEIREMDELVRVAS